MNTTQATQIRALCGPQLARARGWLLTLLFLSLAVATSSAQTVSIRALPLRITVPFGVAAPNPVSVGTTATNAVQLAIVTSQLEENSTNVTFSLSGIPSGVTALLSTNSISSNGTHTAFLTISTDGTVAQGTHDMAIVATGAANYRLPVPVICSYFWSGDSFTNGVSTNISTAGNWLGGAVPGASDNVVFRDRGGVDGLPGPTNIVVASDFEVASLRVSPEFDADANRYHNFEILPGATLRVTGPGGFTMLRDLKGLNRRLEASFSGGGTFLVSNPTADFSLLGDFQANNTLDLSRLDNFVMDVSRMPLGDYRAYPNFFTNGYSGAGTTAGIHQSEPSRFIPLVDLAATNFLRASFADPNNYNDLGWRDYSFTIGNYSQQGSTTGLRFRLGYSNVFYMDSMCFGQALQGNAGTYTFRNNGSYARLRGAAGENSRMSVFAISDSASPAPPRAANVRGTVNWVGGTVDALVDRLFIGVDRTNNSGQMTVQGTLSLALGTFDVNDAYLGYQRSGDNQGAPAPTSTGIAGPEGTVNLSTSVVFKVNGTLNLGYTTATAVGGNTSPERAYGKVFINQSAVCMASNIVIGGVTKLSTNNSIVVNSGTLIVTNAVGAADARLANLTATNGGQIILHGVKVGETNVHVVTFAAPTVGAQSTLIIPSIANLSAFPVTIPVISYVTDSPVFSGLAVIPPAGLFIKSFVNNPTDKTIDITFTDVPPQVLVWRGNVNNNWSTNVTDKNWVTQAGGLQTNFLDGDSVVFDDTATGSSSVNIVGTVTPGQTAAQFGLVVSNSTKNYTFDGGSVLGGSTLKKVGAASLTINAPFSPGVTLSGGSLAGTGSIGSTSLEDGTTMTGFSGAISGGLTASNANVTVSGTGTVAGGLTLRGGSLLNNGIISGTVNLTTNVTLNNAVGATMNVTLPWSVPTNSTLINNGTIVHIPSGANQGLTVNGTLRGVGKITQSGTQLASDVRVTMGAGGTLEIGNTPGEVTNNVIAVRLDLLADSTSTFDVDNATLASDKVFLTDGFIQGKVNFGAGNNLGGRFVVNKTAGPDFNLATVLNLFDLTSNSPDNQNQAIPRVIPAPAPGLVWNVSRVVTNLTIGVIGPVSMTNSIANGTNLVFEWPEAYRGWRLERQTNSLAVGLEWNSTNWVTLVTSFGGTNVYYPDTNDLSQFHYRSVQPIIRTNPAVFYRLTYP